MYTLNSVQERIFRDQMVEIERAKRRYDELREQLTEVIRLIAIENGIVDSVSISEVDGKICIEQKSDEPD